MQVEEWQAEILPVVVLRGAHAHSIMIRTDVWHQSPNQLANETVSYESAPSYPSSELKQMEEVQMLKVELKEGTSVFTSGGEEVGKINRFVLDPRTNEVTHVVVQRGWLLSEDKVVPINMINSATEDRVQLNEDVQEFDELPPFEETHYVRMDVDRASYQGTTAAGYRAAPGYYWYPPHGYLGYPAYGLGYPAWPLTETQQNIPSNTVPLEESTNVMSSDGEHVGDVERLLVDTSSNKATHFVISQGLLFKDRKLVPVTWIDSVAEDEVKLIVSSKVLDQLPSYQA